MTVIWKKIKDIALKRGTLAKILSAGLEPAEPAVIWDDPTQPRLAIGDRDGVPREVLGAAHTHATTEISGLETALAGKADNEHTHEIADVNGLEEALAGAGGGGVTRSTVTITPTASIGTVDLGSFFSILDESATVAGRFRLYRTAAGRATDLARNVGTAPPNNVGILLEDVFTSTALAIAEDPAPCSPGSDGLCAWAWDGATDGTATITLTILTLEA
nr:hypothetical protein [uncultured Holophaga sp.]